MHPVPWRDWRVSLQEHHEGYISWEEYMKNQERLEKNAPMAESDTERSAREGLAYSKGLLVCGSVAERSRPL